jgi:7-cyano-7-deazaguanine synthase
MKTHAIVLHSGGMDSTVCLLKALASGRTVTSLGIDYGQKQLVELEYAKVQCERFGVPRKVLQIAWDQPRLRIPRDRKIADMKKGVAPTFLPGRNAVFLALACAEAGGVGAKEVWIGVNALDFSGYPDCRPAFVRAFQKMISAAIPKGPKIVTPLIHRTKPQIAREAYRRGLRRGEMWCCYRPVIAKVGIVPCGRCDACILHEHAWAKLGA